jgi:hypothetical protein
MISTFELAEAKAIEYAKTVPKEQSFIAKEDFIAGYLEARTDETVETLKLRECLRVVYENAVEYCEYRTSGIIEHYLNDLGLKISKD